MSKKKVLFHLLVAGVVSVISFLGFTKGIKKLNKKM